MEASTEHETGNDIAEFAQATDASHSLISVTAGSDHQNILVDKEVEVQADQQQLQMAEADTMQAGAESIIEKENRESLVVPTPWDNIEAATKNVIAAEQEVSPVSEDQESKIQSLANHLADDLQREHGSPQSIFNFDEFEHEQRQQQALLQLHLHQQQLLHTQYIHRDEHEHKNKRMDLTIQIAESPQQSNFGYFQSPGGNNYSNVAGQAWYYTDATPTYQNRSGSPCSRKDRLYEAMPYQYMEQEFLKGKHVPQHRYKPALVSKAVHRRVEDNKDDFFQRLYDVRKQHTENKITALVQAEVHTAQVVNTVHPRVLTAEERLEVSNRLINHKVRVSRQSQSRRAEFSNNLKEKQNGRHVQPKSQKMVSQLHRKALSEIFDVLLITAQMQRDQAAKEARQAQLVSGATSVTRSANVNDHTPLSNTHSTSPEKASPAAADAVASPHSSPSASTHRKGSAGVPDELDTSLAQAQFLQPKQLSDAMEVILASLNPRCVSREQFIDFTLHCMNKTYLLQRAQQEGRGVDTTASEAEEAAGSFSPHAQAEAQPETKEAAPPGMQSPGPGASAKRPSRSTPQGTPQGTPKSTGKSISTRATGRGVPGVPGAPSSKPGTPAKAPVASAPVVIPPIGYLLVAVSTGGSGTSTQREREEGTAAHREFKNHFTGKPHLVAQKTTEKLAKQRYPERTAGAQSIEDSLISYNEVKRNNTLERSLQLEQEKNRECTFKPNIDSPYMVRYKSAGRAVPASRNVNAMIRSSSSSRRGAASREPSEASEPAGQGLRDSRDSRTETVASAGSSLAGPHPGLRRLDTRPVMIVQDADGQYGVPLGPEPVTAPALAPAHTRAPMAPLQRAHSAALLDQKAYLGFGASNASPNSRVRRANSFLSARPSQAGYAPTQVPGTAAYGVPAVSVPVTAPQPPQQQQRQNSATLLPPPPPDFVADLNAEYGRMSLSSPYSDSGKNDAATQNANAPIAGRFSYSFAGPDLIRKLSSANMKPKKAAQAPLVLHQNSPRTAVYQPYKPAPVSGTGAPATDYKLTQETLQRKMYQDLYYNTP